MASCELCGKPATIKAKIEGTLLSVCVNCAGFGKVVQETRPMPKVKVVQSLKAEQSEYFLVPDFGQRLKNSRHRMSLTERNAAKALNIRESTLLHFEAGKLQPDDAAIKKLEKFYGISLTQRL